MLEIGTILSKHIISVFYGNIGYQKDGSYIPCPDCKHIPAPDPEGPGIVIPVLPRTPGTAIHNGGCPQVPRISDETRHKLIEMDRQRRRAEVESRNFFIG
jgi:hypothetical protein